MDNAKVLLARQAIYDRRLRVFGYELLFRAGDTLIDPLIEGDRASSDVLLNAFGALPVSDILDGKPAFINFTRHLLEHPPPVDRRQLVVEVLEQVVIDERALAALRALKQQGYTIALDDYRYRSGDAALLRLADLIKIDVLATPMDSLPSLIALLRPFDVRLLAEKVETHEMFKHCRQLGFELFQGYFLARPQLMHGHQLNAGQQSVLRLIGVMQSAEAGFLDIERVILTDSVLSFKLLRLVNSAQFNLSRRIDSIQHALTLLGLERIRSWATLLALSGLAERPTALYMSAMLRARMCQALGQRLGYADEHAERLFMAGLLSTLDLFLDVPLPDILRTIDLNDELRQAILQHDGDDGLLLNTAICFEQGELDPVRWPALEPLGLDHRSAGEAYVDSLRWARSHLDQLF